MNLKPITKQCEVDTRAGGARVQVPRVGGINSAINAKTVEVFADEHSNLTYIVLHSPSERVLQIRMHAINEPSSYGNFMIEGGLYDRFVSEYEHVEGLSLHRMQSIIWVMNQMGSASRQDSAEEVA